MGHVHGDDLDLHYSDGAHNWAAPDGIDEAAWHAGIRAHIDAHLEHPFGGDINPPPRRPGEDPRRR